MSDDDGANRSVQIGIKLMRFGEAVVLDNGQSIIADEGDTLLVLPHLNGMESFYVLSPDQARTIGEHMIDSALRGAEMLRLFNEGIES